jgi:tetratricopeptide (TPR) repeat protein
MVLFLAALLLSPACQKKADEPALEELLTKKTLNPAEQQKVATALFQEMFEADEDNLELFEKNYKLVLEKCPDTKKAHTAVWRLTNLYTLAYEDPQYEKIIAILEPFLKRYSESKIVSMKKYPEEILIFSPLSKLHQAYAELGQFHKIIAHYEKITASGQDLEAIDCFDFADALDQMDRQKEAVTWYDQFLTKSEQDQDVDFLREVAQDRIKEIGGQP